MDAKLTAEEKEVLDHLAAACNKFISLPGVPSPQKAEFQAAIHAAQYLVSHQVASRADPDRWL